MICYDLSSYPTPEVRRQNRKETYPWTKDEKKAKTLLMESAMRSVCRRPMRSASPPHTKAPTIIPRYTIRPMQTMWEKNQVHASLEVKI